MGIEIERKFLVRNEDWRALVTASKRLVQGYLAVAGDISVRVRIVDETAAALTLKTRKAGLSRAEFEYVIPPADAHALITLCRGAAITKVRHLVPWRGLTWEIDVFEGENAGLTIAEIELEAEGQTFAKPTWLGREVTGDERYYNSALVIRPFRSWPSVAPSTHSAAHDTARAPTVRKKAAGSG